MLAPMLALAMMQKSDIPTRTPVTLECTCNGDSVSRQYASKLRDLLAASPRYREVQPTSSSDVTFRISVVTVISGGTKESTDSISVSVVILIGSVFLDQSAQSCGALAIDQCAANTLSFFDSALHR